MLTAPSPALGVIGWVLLALLWLGLLALAGSVARSMWRWMFPPRVGEYVRVLHELPPHGSVKR